jgi:hypothetical protein
MGCQMRTAAGILQAALWSHQHPYLDLVEWTLRGDTSFDIRCSWRKKKKGMDCVDCMAMKWIRQI